MEEIIYEQRKKSNKLIEFEERKGIILSFYFPCVTCYWRYGMIRSKYNIIPVLYFIILVPPISCIAFAIDLLLNAMRVSPKIIKFLVTNIMDLLKWIIKASWEVCGDIIKSVVQKTLSVLGFFIALLCLYMLFKSDVFQAVASYILDMLRDTTAR